MPVNVNMNGTAALHILYASKVNVNSVVRLRVTCAAPGCGLQRNHAAVTKTEKQQSAQTTPQQTLK